MSTHDHVTVEVHRAEVSPERVLEALVAASDAPEDAFETLAGMDDGRDWWVDEVDVESAVRWAYAWAGNLHFEAPDWSETDLLERLALVARTYPELGRVVIQYFQDTSDYGRVRVFEAGDDGYVEVEDRSFAFDRHATRGQDVYDPRLPGDGPVREIPRRDVVAAYLQGKYGIHTWVGWRNRDALHAERFVGDRPA